MPAFLRVLWFHPLTLTSHSSDNVEARGRNHYATRHSTLGKVQDVEDSSASSSWKDR